jgi:hypothetical protein
MKSLTVASLIILVFGGVFFAAYKFGLNKQISQPTNTSQSSFPTETPLGGDRDEHGCIPSAGYSWCEAKQKCLRTWEEECVADSSSSEEDMKAIIKQLIVAKHGPDSEKLDITVSALEGDYAKGGASEAGLGGGMWFAAKVNGNWELVWDGNGIITCEDVSPYPDFPADMIPECFDPSTQEMVTR